MALNPPADLLVAMFALSVATGGLLLVTGRLGFGGHYHHLLDPAPSLFMNLITFALGMLHMIVSVACFSTAPSVAVATAAKVLRCLTLVMSFTALLLHFTLLVLISIDQHRWN